MKGIVAKISRGLALGAAMVLSVGLATTSCTNERLAGDVEEGRQQLTFAPTVSETWREVAQKSGEGAGATRATADSGLGSVVSSSTLELGSVAGDSLYLHVTTTEGIESSVGATSDSLELRAAPVTDVQTHGGFGVTAYYYDAGASATGTPNLMNNVFYDTVSSGEWKATSSTHRWMPGKLHDFYAWAPYGTTDYSVNSPTGGAAPTLSVTIPTSVADQKDLLVAQAKGVTEPTSGTGVQPLTFNHALTAVKFVAKEVNVGIEITSITLEGVLNQGTYDFGTGLWTPLSGQLRVSFTQNFSSPVTSTGTSGQEITGGATTFMMLPQQFDSSTPLTIKVGYRDGGTTGEITGTITTPHTWEAGKTVTYEISSTSINYSYTFVITQDPASVPHTGGSSTFRITSTRQKSIAGALVEPVSFEIKEVYDEATSQWTSTIPSWFNGGSSFSSTGGTNVSGSIGLTAQTTSIMDIPGLATLQGATHKGSASAPYTLEDEGGTISAETANCYVIQAPGHYSLPLVYGNAITNGATNSSAYTSTASGTTILSPFINHLGQPITDPKLPTPSSAGIVWQDEKDLVTNVRLEGGRLLFEVDKNNIREGNAVIAVYDSNNSAIWSWHIWVTAQDVFTPISVKTHSTFGAREIKFMPCNLGEARGTTETFPGRTIRAKVVQSGSNREEQVTFVQNEGAKVGGHRSPYYQWGRKDPFQPSNGINNTNQTWYNSSGVAQTGDPSTANWARDITSISNGIANPGTFNINSYMDQTYFNLWNMNNSFTTVNGNSVVKTIYDPTPRGYKMPPPDAFTGFTTTGFNTSTSSELNVVGSFDKGWHFKTGFPAPNDKIFFPASGRRNYSSASLLYVGSYGDYWTAGPYNTSYGRYLGFLSGYVGPQGYNYRSYGFSVRPCQ